MNYETGSSAVTFDSSANYRIINRKSGKVLEVVGASTVDGVLIDQWTYSSRAIKNGNFFLQVMVIIALSM